MKSFVYNKNPYNRFKPNILKTAIPRIMATVITTMTLYSIMNVAQASGLLVKVHGYYHELPKSVSDVCNTNNNCPEIEISYVNSSKAWVNTAMNQNINEMIAGDSVYPLVTFIDYNVKVPSSVKHSLDEFAKTQMDDMIEGMGLSYSKSVEPRYLGHTGSLELFEIVGYDYWGGAHGINFVSYSILDSDIKEEVSLDDMLLKSEKTALSKLVEAEFDKWIIKRGYATSEHKDYWTFSMTDNVTFTAKGLSFVYQPYAIASYADGMPELTVPYNKLRGIVKPKYLLSGMQLADH